MKIDAEATFEANYIHLTDLLRGMDDEDLAIQLGEIVKTLMSTASMAVIEDVVGELDGLSTELKHVHDSFMATLEPLN